MHTPSLLVALSALTTLTSAIPYKRTPTCVTITPTSYTIGAFTIFTPATSNPTPPSLYFTFYDSAISVQAICSLNGNTTVSMLTPCSNPAVGFTFDGSVLNITEVYTSCSSNETVTAESELSISTFCYPSEPPLPSGYGRQCEAPTGQITGFY